MKTSNAVKKQTSQPSGDKNTNTHIKIVKPRPNGNGSEVAIQGPRDCFPLG
jgi:hypothetical protein